ncbi:MAG: hypothetical protein QGG53_04405 [Planctomycetota bacterium]|jgi:hypothetical protein|nr:hypothetical protein [Planctomycetota bacterium]
MPLSIKIALWLGAFGMACANADPFVVAKAEPAVAASLEATQHTPARSTESRAGSAKENILVLSWLSDDFCWSSGRDFLAGMSDVLSEPWKFTRRQSSLETPEFDLGNWDPAKPQIKAVRMVSGTESLLSPRFDVNGGWQSADFDYAKWVTQNEVKRFKRYVNRRQVDRDEYYDLGKARSRDLEYAYRIYFKGNMSDYLDESDAWHAEFFGNFIEQVDGIVNILGVIEDTILKNNLFRPKNPFKKWSENFQSRRNSNLQITRPQFFSSPAKAWEWEGDISIGGSASGLDLDEVTLHLGQFRFSERFKIEVDLFYLEEKRN